MTRPRRQVITWGVAVVVVGAAVSLVTLTHRGEQEIRQVARAEVGHHRDRAIDRAHPELPRRYVTRRELNAQLHKIDKRLLRIEQQQTMILERLPLRKHWTRDPKYRPRLRRRQRSY